MFKIITKRFSISLLVLILFLSPLGYFRSVKADTFKPQTASSVYDDLTGNYGLLGIASQVVENSDFSDMNNRVIDFSNATATDQIFISIEADVLSVSTPLKISNPNGAMLIFNVVGASDSLNINSKIEYGTRVNHETETFTDAKILWNFGNSLKTLNVNQPFQGTVLTPEAAVTAYQNLDGSIIATDVTINAESHRWDLAPLSITAASIVNPSTSSSSSLSTSQESSTPVSSSSSSTQESSTPQSSSSSFTHESSTTESSSSSFTHESSTTESSSTTSQDPATSTSSSSSSQELTTTSSSTSEEPTSTAASSTETSTTASSEDNKNDKQDTTTETSDADSLPQTGDSANILLPIGISLLSLASLAVVFRKRA